MKEIKISVQRQKKELFILLLSFILAFLLNVYSIIHYNGEWSELYTEIFYVLSATAIIYVLLFLTRLPVKSIKRLFIKNKQY